MSETKSAITLELVVPTVFPDLNKKNGYPDDHETSSIEVQRMKHKHFRKMQSMQEQKQIHYVMSALTGLSDNDLDELDVEDSAKLSEVIFSFMQHHAELAKKMMGDVKGQ